jgi:hypothetical protein
VSPWRRRTDDTGETPDQTIARLNAEAERRRPPPRPASAPPPGATSGATTLSGPPASLAGPWLDEVVGPDGVRVTFRVDPAVPWWQQAMDAMWRRYGLRNTAFARWTDRVGTTPGPVVPASTPWALTAEADDGRKVRVVTATRAQAVTVGHELAGLVRRHGATALDRWR